jgi:hypothetical protein
METNVLGKVFNEPDDLVNSPEIYAFPVLQFM